MEVDIVYRSWWSYLLRGIVAVIFAILLFALPESTLKTLMIIFGIFLVIDGAINAIRSIVLASRKEKWGWTLIWGIVGFLLGAVILKNNGAVNFTVAFVAILAGVWVIILGIAEIAIAFDMPPDSGRGIIAVIGILSIAFGIVFIAAPYGSVYAFMVVLGIYLIAKGGYDIFFSFYARKRQKEIEQGFQEA